LGQLLEIACVLIVVISIKIREMDCINQTISLQV